MKIDFRKTTFVKTAVKASQYPKKPLPELAVVGRSNVGKSSLLNYLFDRKSLVKTSATPGKTRTIQFFEVDEKLMLVDLPGYGFAKTRQNWDEMITTYLEERKPTLLMLIDIRRGVTELDMQLIGYAQGLGLSILLAITKADKLAKTKRKAPDLPFPHVITSVPKRIGRQELIQMIQCHF